ncbi:hypothetical protein PHLGIDRAFT_18067 [Phlebiopsis gigantea 11061_1 CR5-6]|uniref:Uncharacterized protein n=1 Tax=Phlebiopsis gigantea (strain 11061_1 CR5-6) TaxID=745531 RepID=A0A0C3S568_PHLG1|nr:hypothetical protein PHLGIDRAFT_18067 [Phlebiopsis gigantea 11061_1 CR5-6]
MPYQMERATSLPLPDNVPSHPPAQKVGGRRMSITSRSKPHAAHTEHKPAADTADNDTGPTDYPRPAPPGEQPPHEHHQHEEEQPRREKKHGMSEHERRAHDIQHKKADLTRPSKEISLANKVGGMRIAQPAGKGVGL